MNIKKIIGTESHKSSNLCLSGKFSEKFFILITVIVSIIKLNIIIIDKIIVRSWKNNKNSIIGLFLFCKLNDIQKGIFKYIYYFKM
jgi:hypothetical protein